MMSKNRYEWFMLISQLLAQLSDKITSLGLIWYITTQFGESWLTWYLVIGGLPHLLLSGYSGRVIQQWTAIKTVYYSDLARAFLFIISFFYFENELKHDSSLYMLLGLIFSVNVFSAFFNPAILTLPLEVEDEERVQTLTARLTTVSSLTTVIGPLLGLVLFNQFGLKGLFVINFICYAVSSFFARKLFRVSQLGSMDKKSNHSSSSSSFHSVPIWESLSRNKLIAVMLLLFLFMNLFLSPIQVLMPVLAKNLFSKSFNVLAYMELFFGLGVVFGGLFLSLVSIHRRELFWVWFFLLFFSLIFVLFHFQASLIFILICLLLMGVTLGLVNVLIVHLFQEHPLKTDVPNIMSVVNLISTASVPVSLSLLALLQKYMSVIILSRMSSLVLLALVVVSVYPFKKLGKDLFQ
ncbi:MAG: MFS transporter [Bdellovibrionaceae bacterium]|nr:MFS transporter [Pseudobdellovibrionaceae bacterium]NUM57251.1 MFS transporter [Pseudobdellovibrionaceae bacterium]